MSSKFPDALVIVREEISESLVDAAASGEIDILIEVLPFDEAHLYVESLFLDEFYVAVHQDNPLSRLDEIPINALENIPFILLEDIHCLARQIEQYCFDENFMPKVLFKTSQLATVKQLIEINYGISILPSIAIDKGPNSNIRYIKLKDKVSRVVVLATAKERYFSPAAKFFISTVKGQFRSVN